MTIYIGIDVAKRFHIAALVDEDGQPITQLRFDNNASGYQHFFACIDRYRDGGEPVIGMESTGHYGAALRDRLVEHGYTVQVLNPLKPNRFRDFYLQPVKNDARDAFVIAQMLRFGERQPYVPAPPPLRALKHLVRYRAALTQARARMKNQLRAILDEVFPEYQQESLFANLFGASSLAVLRRFPTPACLLAAPEAELVSLLKQSSRGRLGEERAQQLRQAASRSVGSTLAGQAYATVLPDLIAGYQALEERIATFTARIEAELNTTEQTLTTIPGVGPVLAATILAEIGDVTRFPSSDHLVAYAGLAVGESQSGQGATRRFLSRRGLPQLRGAFFQAALAAVRFDPHLGAYYQRRVKSGLPRRQAIIAVARKLVRITYALLKSGAPYQPPEPEP